ncbi:MFS transporter [Nocardioides mangrovicus]|uniref:MFS transporter n=1 Tax=Nocardioides mangrovicus TaxID=2478913 RepID=A0A3L8P0X7_9ACTN|nr:MFS transporter [Nocardioides mangrovicus]
MATIVLYYQFYLAGAVAAGTDGKNGILVDYDMSFVYYVNIAVVGYLLGAAASFVTGVADRYGRVTIITVGLVVVALLCLIGIPLADSKIGFGIVFVLIGVVEGIILVATPALIRDFSPQLGRASAMGFWTLGPVLGSLVVSIQISSTSNTTPWHHQYIAAGVVGLIVAGLSAVFLRELSPALRDQVMVSERDRALVEARAQGIDVSESLRSPFRQMLKPDIVLSAFAISVFLIIYYVAVGFFPVYFQTVFGFSQSRANSLGNWIWAFNAGALLVIGYLSDRVRVRKPFMVVGALGAIVMTIVFLSRATHPTTSYGSFVVILVLLAMFLGLAYAPWMASFTETVEKRNPALTATGLAVWGLVIRLVIAVSVFIVPHVVTTVSTLVQEGPSAQALAVKYHDELATAAKLSPSTSAALAKDPTDQTAGIKAVSEVTGISVDDVTTVATLAATPGATPTAEQQQLLATDGPKIQAATSSLQALGEVPKSDLALLQRVQGAAEESPKQWQHYFWIAVGGEIVFIPLIFLLVGAWNPRTARRRQEEHEEMVSAELEKLRS